MSSNAQESIKSIDDQLVALAAKIKGLTQDLEEAQRRVNELDLAKVAIIENSPPIAKVNGRLLVHRDYLLRLVNKTDPRTLKNKYGVVPVGVDMYDLNDFLNRLERN